MRQIRSRYYGIQSYIYTITMFTVRYAKRTPARRHALPHDKRSCRIRIETLYNDTYCVLGAPESEPNTLPAPLSASSGYTGLEVGGAGGGVDRAENLWEVRNMLTSEQKVVLLNALASGALLRTAAALVGLDLSGLRDLQRQDPELAEEIRQHVAHAEMDASARLFATDPKAYLTASETGTWLAKAEQDTSGELVVRFVAPPTAVEALPAGESATVALPAESGESPQ